MWNLNKENGWKNYTDYTENNVKFKEVAENVIGDPSEAMNKIEKELDKAKHRSFGKVTYRKGKQTINKLAQLQSEKCKVRDASTREALDAQINKEILKEQKSDFEKKVEQLKVTQSGKGRCAAIYSLKNEVVGRKKEGQVATTLIDPETNEEISDRNQIKKASLRYCVDLLTNRDARPGFEDDIEFKNLVHVKRMEIKAASEPELTRDMFDASLNELAKKNMEKYAFILKGGADLHHALFKLFKHVWDKEVRPNQCNLQLLYNCIKERVILDFCQT